MKRKNKNTKNHMSKKRKILISSGIALLVISIGICLYFPISTAIQNHNIAVQKEELSKNLDSCLSKAHGISSVFSEQYEAMIECYEKYHVDGYQNRIAALKNDMAIQKRTECLDKAWDELDIIDSDKANVQTVTDAITVLQRYNANYESQISCYKDYGDDEFEDKINELTQQIAKNNDAISAVSSNPGSYYTQMPEIDYQSNHNFHAPSIETSPALTTPTCDEYRNQYYANYQNSVTQTQTRYNSAISSASMQCGGQGGCPAVTELKRQLEAELNQLRATYESNMSAVGCAP